MHWMQRIHRPTAKSSELMILDCHCREARERDYRAFRRVQAGPTGSLTPRWREVDSNFRFRVRCKSGLMLTFVERQKEVKRGAVAAMANA